MSRFKNNFFLLLFPFILLPIIFPFSSINGNFQIDPKDKNDFLKFLDNFPAQKPTKDELHHYNISVEYSPTTHSATGYINISFLNKETSPVSDLLFHLWGNGVKENSISINGVINNSGNALLYNVESTKLAITTEPIQFNQRYNISIDFTTILPQMPDGFRFGYTLGTYSFHAFGNWHPVLAVREDGDWNRNPYASTGESFYSEMAYYDIWIRTNITDKIAAAADLQEVLKNGNEFIYHYTSGPVRDFAWVSSPDYQIYSEIYKGVNISSYYYPGNERAILAVDITKKSMDLFSELFEPWPYETMTIAELDRAWFSGMEYNQLIMINHVNYQPFDSNNPGGTRTVERFEGVITHEWAHSWNTYIIANNPYIDPWLDEAWAMYGTSLYFEQYGKQEYEKGRQNSLRENYINFKTANSYFDSPLGSGMDHWDFNPGGGEILYDKGAVVIDMLRYVMGDDAFFEALVDLYDTFSYNTFSASEFIELFNNHVDDDISWFFDQFVYDTVILDYEILSAIANENKTTNNWDITINVKNKYKNDPNVMKVPFKIKFDSGAWSSFDVIIDEAQERILHELPLSMGEPEFVILDPDWKLLRQIGIISKDFGTTEVISSSSITDSNPSTTNLVLLPSVIAIIAIIYYRSKKDNY
ncbi:MAG: M1 family metallopeptidase [Candidatus Hodarchaeales archaeon]